MEEEIKLLKRSSLGFYGAQRQEKGRNYIFYSITLYLVNWKSPKVGIKSLAIYI